MRILIDMGHPAHVHFFKNFIWEMEKRGHEITITIRDKEILSNLLEKYNFNYTILSTMRSGKFWLIVESFIRELKLFMKALKYKPDVMLGVGGTWIAHVSKATGIPSIIFTDYPLWYDRFITYPFTDIILTPISFSRDIGKKQIKIEGYKELAYLHPDLFHPNDDIFDLIGLKKGEHFVLIRFASFNAAHDSSAYGFDFSTKRELVELLKDKIKVVIIPAEGLPEELIKYSMNFPIERIHDALFYADYLISDSQTMTTEAAVLGTPVLRYNSWVGPLDALNFIELEDKYHLIYNYDNPRDVLVQSVRLLEVIDIKKFWEYKRKKMLEEKINVTHFLVWLIENFQIYSFETRQDYYQKYREIYH